MKLGRSFLILWGLIFLHLSAVDLFSQIIPAEGTPPAYVCDDAQKLPNRSGSYMEIFVNGEWTSNVTEHFDPQKPTLVLVHGWRRGNLDADGRIISMSIAPYWTYATTALSQRVKQPGVAGDMNLLSWNWVIPASTREIDPLARYSVVVPLQAVYNEGLLLAQTLKNLSPVGKVHLLGHSLGAKLVGIAGCFSDGVPLDQVTLMDGPEIDTGNTPLKAFVDSNPVQLSENIKVLNQRKIYVDSYASAFGGSYAGKGIPCTQLFMIEDANLTQMIQLALDAHGFPIAWYFGGSAGLIGYPAGTIDAGTGDICQPVGAAWSMVLNRKDSEEAIIEQRRIYTYGADPCQPISGLDHELFDRIKQPYSLVGVASIRDPEPVTRQTLDFISGGPATWQRQGDVYFTQTDPATAVLTCGSTVYLFTTVSVPNGQVTFDFDFRMEAPLPTDRFTLYVDDKLYFQVQGDAFPADEEGFIHLGPIDVSDFAGKSATFTFCYSSVKAGQCMKITNVHFDSNEILPQYILIGSARYGHGSVFPKNRSFVAGTKVTMTAVPDLGHHVFKWSEPQMASTVPVGSSITVAMTKNKKVEVQFAIDPQTCWLSGTMILLLGIGCFKFLEINPTRSAIR